MKSLFVEIGLVALLVGVAQAAEPRRDVQAQEPPAGIPAHTPEWTNSRIGSPGRTSQSADGGNRRTVETPGAKAGRASVQREGQTCEAGYVYRCDSAGACGCEPEDRHGTAGAR
jgi:hypothetical protein